MASPDRASRNLQLSPKSYELGVQIPLPSAARGPPARLVVPGTRWHPKRAAGLPPGARAAAAEPAAGSLGSEPRAAAPRRACPQSATGPPRNEWREWPSGPLRDGAELRARPPEGEARGDEGPPPPSASAPRPCKRHRTSPLPREHHRGVPRGDLRRNRYDVQAHSRRARLPAVHDRGLRSTRSRPPRTTPS